MTKDQWQQQLIEDPRYDADWIDVASTLLSTYTTEQLKEAGIIDLDDLVPLDVRFIHIINSLLENYNFDEEYYEYKNDLISTMIAYLVKHEIPINATQAQLIATIIGAIVTGKIEGEELKERFNSDIVGELIEANIPYTSLNFIAKGIIEGHNEILKYSNSGTDVVAELYATMADGVYDKINELLHLDQNTDDCCLDLGSVSLQTIKLLRFLINNGCEFTTDEDGSITIPPLTI